MSAEALAGLKAYWEGLTPERLAILDTVYAPEARFRDPFNDVRGVEEIRRVFGHMYDTLLEPRFTVRETLLDGARAVLVWDFDFRIRAWRPQVPQRIHGLTLVRFAPDGRVAEHLDYWDAAGELYAKLPVAGPLVRWLARRMA